MLDHGPAREDAQHRSADRALLGISAADAIDLDHVLDAAAEMPAECVTQCDCGARRSILRHMAVSPCAGRAMARLKAAHLAEYAGYLAELKATALAEFEQQWRNHLAGNHGRRSAPQ